MRTIFTSIAALLLGAVVCTPVSTQAQNCSRPGFVPGPVYTPPRVVSDPYVHEVVHEVAVPVAVPVVVPATVFQFLPAVTPAVQAAPVAVQQQVVQQAAPAMPAAQVPAAAASRPQAAVTRDAVDALIRERLEAILREKMTGLAEDDPPPLAGGDLKPQQPVSAATPAEVQNKALSLLVQHCNVCHGDKGFKGDVQLFHAGADGRLLFQPTKEGQPLGKPAIAQVVSSGRMPKVGAAAGNRALLAGEKQDLLAWLTQP